MKLWSAIAAALLAVLLATAATAIGLPSLPWEQLARQADIPFTRFTLPNGLSVIVHTDRKAPVVAVAVWYGVGARDEPAGRTGFAHLFEHLMFDGSENIHRNVLDTLRDAGATDANGTTSFDYTRYFETVPVEALERTLYIESDRMGHLLGAVDQKRLDRERAIVLNEKRQEEGEPLGTLDDIARSAVLPAGHPYSHPITGSAADLDRATLADVRGWFSDHYGPRNAVLVLAGDIDVVRAKMLATRYFGDLPAGKTSMAPKVLVPTLPAPKRIVVHDAIGAPHIEMVWAIPGRDDRDLAALDVGADALGGLVASRLDTALVRDEPLTTRASAGVESYDGISFFRIRADVKQGVDPERVERRVGDVLHDIIATGPTADEVERAKAGDAFYTIAGLEWLGGYVGKAAMLAQGAVAGNPSAYRDRLSATLTIGPGEVHAAMQRWLTRPAATIVVLPGAREGDSPAPTVSKTIPAVEVVAEPHIVARPPIPPLGPPSTPSFPPVQTATLANGIKVRLVSLRDVPTIRVTVMIDAGHAADPPSAPGTQELMLSMQREGTSTRSAADIASLQQRLGFVTAASASRDRSSVSLQGLSAGLAPGLALVADMVRNPAFPPAALERLRASQLSRIAQERNYPAAIVGHVMPPILYGPAHPYGGTEYALGDPATINRLTRDDLIAFHDRWYRPDTTEIFVVGDTTMAQLMPLLEADFGSWRNPPTPRPRKDFGTPLPPAQPEILLVDRPGSAQSQIFAGERLDLRGTDDLTDLDSAVDILGGDFDSRINTDLRVRHGWSYGADAMIDRGVDHVALRISAPVDAAHTGEAIAAIRDDLRAFLGENGVTDAELRHTVAGKLRAMPGRFEAAASVIGELQRRAIYRLPEDDLARTAERYRTQTPADLDRAARSALSADRLTWVVVGGEARIMPQLRSLGLPVRVTDIGAATP